MKVKFIVTLIIIQIIIIAFLVYTVYKKQKNVLGTTSINFINKESVTFNPSGNLRYFYEPKANTIEYSPDWLPFKVAYTINNDSLNDRYNYPFKKPDRVFRIITLGDSFTYGVGVYTKDNWAEILEDKLNKNVKCAKFDKFEVINLGVGGYDFEYSAERFKRRGIKYSPDLIIWLLIDFNRIDEKVIPLNSYLFEQLAKKKVSLYDLVKKGNYYDTFKTAIQQVEQNFGDQAIFNYQKEAIMSINNYYVGKLLLIVPPWFNNMENKFLQDFAKTRPQSSLYDESWTTFGNDNRLPDGHPNKNGHEIIAENIFQYLMQNNTVPCQ